MEKRQVIRKTTKGPEKDGYEFHLSPKETEEIFKEHLREKHGEPIPKGNDDVDVDIYREHHGATRIHVHRKRK